MLGRSVRDPLGIESATEYTNGLGLIDFETELASEKQLVRAEGSLALGDAPVKGYEIHMGTTTGRALARPAMWLRGPESERPRPDGAISDDGQLFATYLHGLFDTPDACAALLRWAGLDDAARIDHDARRHASIDKLADAVAAHVDVPALWRMIE